MANDTKIVSYTCKTCKTVFFTAEDVAYHKGMTGHGVYEQNVKDLPANRSARPIIDKVYWCKKCHAAFVFRIDAANHKQETGHADIVFASLNSVAE